MQKTEKIDVQFPNGRGQMLAGTIDRPVGEPLTWGLFVHCFTCSRQIVTARRVCQALAQQRIAMLRFDLTGLGDSEGDFADTSFTTNLEDTRAAIGFLSERGTPPALLLGHSLGGAAALAVASETESIKAVATINAPADPSHLNPVFAAHEQEFEQHGEAMVDVAGQRFRFRKAFLDDLQGHRLTARIGRLNRPLLILHTPDDEIVSIDEARKIFQAARHPKSFVSLEAADHLLTGPQDTAYAASLIAAWASRYLPSDAQQTVVSAWPRLAENEVLVRELGDAYSNEIHTAHHRFVADEPLALGGRDLGPKPTEQLLAALGACTAITLRMYFDHKQWPMGRISVRVRRRATEKNAPARLLVSIHLPDPLEPDRLKRVQAIASRCPVNRLLAGETDIAHEVISQPQSGQA